MNPLISLPEKLEQLDVVGSPEVGHVPRGNGTGYDSRLLQTGDVVGLDLALSGKAASVHTHAISQIVDLQTVLDGKVTQAQGDERWGRLAAANSWSAANTFSQPVVASVGAGNARGAFDGIISNATTTGITVGRAIELRSTGTPAANFGVRDAFYLKSSTTNAREAAYFDVGWSDPSDATRTSVIDLSTSYQGTMQKAVTFGRNASFATMSIGGVTAWSGASISAHSAYLATKLYFTTDSGSNSMQIGPNGNSLLFGTVNSGAFDFRIGGVSGFTINSLGATASSFRVGSNQVVGSRQSAIANHATDTTVNAILAALRNHGLIAT